MAYVMYMTSIISGTLNYKQLSSGKDLDLKVFDFPHIGGGLVMSASRARTVLILIRLIALVAIAVANFGLEGRTALMTEVREAVIRRPGIVEKANTGVIFDATELQRRCARTVNGELKFGAVIDGNCYHSVSEGVYITGMSLNFTSFNKSAVGCSIERNERRLLTVYRCEDVDMSCLGLFREGDVVSKGRCQSVIYDAVGVWLCPVLSVRPGVEDEQVLCRRMYARREDVSQWPTVFWTFTLDLETSLFGSAYAQEERRQVEVPTSDRNITVITLYWLIPAAIQLFLVWVVTAWAIVVRRHGKKVIFNDEAKLTKFIQSRDGVMLIRAEGCNFEVGGVGGVRALVQEDNMI